MSEYLFSYGTLQKAEVQLKLFGRLLNGTKDCLEGYKASKVEIIDEGFLAKGEQSVQLAAIASDGDTIEGMVFELTADELSLADTYEPVEYSRVQVTLASGKLAWVYLKI
ncbi:MAG TPA: gamma-glutamylcyclotransferase [Pyrinomonadaceae bacterium]|nr:gamma-glutamylcyclotransferase [Pyrinomonadaceae bacterium]